jgi:hypothetical protein
LVVVVVVVVVVLPKPENEISGQYIVEVLGLFRE